MRAIWNSEVLYIMVDWALMIWVLRRYFVKESLLGNNFFKGTKLEKNDDCKEFIEFYRTQHKKIDLIIILILGMVIFYITIIEGIPMLRDYPLLKKNEYEVVVGYANTESTAVKGNVRNRRVNIRDTDTGEIIEVILYTTEIYKGDYLVVYYLPHTKFGEVVDKIHAGG